jgi:hypothetical protein
VSVLADEEEHASHSDGDEAERGKGIGAAVGGIGFVMIVLAHGFAPQKLMRQSSGAGGDFNDSLRITPEIVGRGLPRRVITVGGNERRGKPRPTAVFALIFNPFNQP